MADLLRVLKGGAVVMAATIGAGIFALPYVFAKAGIAVGFFYLSILSAIIIYAQILYWRSLDAVGEKKRLLGLAKDYLGKFGYVLGFATVVCGLILVLVIQLILGAKFLGLVFPVGRAPSLIVFWFLAILPLFFKEKRIIWLETLVVAFMAAIVFFILFSFGTLRAPQFFPMIDLKNIFLPFGAVLFALAGWTAIEPLYDSFKSIGSNRRLVSLWGIALGTVFVAVLYAVFVFIVLTSAPIVSSDTISGIAGWSQNKTALLGILGILGLWVSYLPVTLEIKHALIYDLAWNKKLSGLAVIFLPVILVFSGLNNFIKAIGLAGGVFLGLEYLLIVLVGKKIIRPKGLEALVLNALSFVFVLAAVYEIYYFFAGA